MTCRTCKYWDNTNPFDAIAFNCHKEGDEIGLCKLASHGGDHGPKQDYKAIATCGGESIYGELVTKAQFGCIQYEQN
jgi:hypothetical protein